MTFVSPFYLFFLPLVLVPIIIHLFFKKKPKIVKFSNLFFLQILLKDTLPKSKLKNLILLILRVLIIFFLILIFARPVIYYLPFQKIKDNKILILLDCSYSMRYFEIGKTRFDISKEICDKILPLISPNDEISLILFSNKIENFLPFTNNKEVIKNTIKIQEPTYMTTDIAPALKFAEENFSKIKKTSEKILVIISDFNQNLISNIPSNFNFDPDIKILCFVIGKEEKNIFVENASTDPSLNLHVQLNNKEYDAKKYKISTYINENWKDEDVIEIPKNKPSFYQTKIPKHLNFHSGYVKVEDDELAIDNVFYFCSDVPQEIGEILIIDGDPKFLNSINSETYFLSKALTDTYPVKVITSKEIESEKLDKYEIVILANVETIPQQIANKNLIIFLGDKINIKNYTETLQFQAKETEEKNLNFFSIDGTHPAFKNLIIDEFEFKNITIKRKFLLAGQKEIIKLEDNSPALIETKNAFLFNTTADKEWTNLPIKPLFSPLMRSLINYLYNKKLPQIEKMLYVNQPFTFVNNQLKKVEIYNPLNKVEVFTFSPKIVFKNTSLPGIYKLIIENKKNFFAVNLERGPENNLSKIDKNKFVKLFKNNYLKFIESNNWEKEMKIFFRGKEITTEFFFLLLLLLVAETIFANLKSVFRA